MAAFCSLSLSAAMASQQPPPQVAAAAPSSKPAAAAAAVPTPISPNLAYLNPIDRTAYTKNVVNAHTTASSSASTSSASPHSLSASTSAPPLVFDPELLTAPTFDPHTFITTSIAQPPHSSSNPTSAPPSLQSLHTSLTSYSSSLHGSLVQLLNSQFESFIALSSSLLPLPPLLSTIEDYAEQVREKTRALLLVLQDKRVEEDSKRREWSVEEERERWLTELSDCVERVRTVQAVMAEVEEAAEVERIAHGAAEEGEEQWVSELSDAERAVVRRALRASREGSGSEEKRRREERRQKRREDQAPLPPLVEAEGSEDEDDVDGEDEYEADEAIKRQHNQAYDLFLSLLSTPPTNPSTDSSPSSWPFHSPLAPSQLYRLTHLTFLFISLRASMTLMSQFHLVSSLQSTVSSLYASFLSHLQRAFLTALSSASASSSTSTLTSVLRLYVLLDERSTCESIVKEQLLLPSIQSIFSPGTLRTNQSGASGGTAVSNLAVLYDRVLELVERVVCVLNEATYAFSPRAFDWFGDVFFSTLAAQLTTLATALFSPGTPSVFHYHYTLSCSLLSSLSALSAASSGTASSDEQSQSLLSHPAVDGFMKRWNLSIYFMLRFQTLAAAVEAACSLPVEQQQVSEKSSIATSGWRVAAVSGVVEGTVLQCWADGVWLAELSGQFVKLSLQCVERYCLMVESGCNLTSGGAANVSGASANGAAAADGGSTVASTGSGEVACAFPVELLFAYHDDVERMDAFIAKRLSPTIVERLPAGPDSASSLASSLSPTVTRVRSLLPLLLSSLTALLSSAAAVPLSAVPGLRQLYRMSKKGPTAPSPYVAQLIAILVKQQHTGAQQPSKRTGPAWQSELLRLVVGRVCDAWSERVHAVMDVALKMEASLRLLKKKGADGAGSEASEVEKIRSQLELDVREFERAAREELRVTVDEVQPLQQLQRVIHTIGANNS